MGDPQRRLVKDDIGVLHERCHQLAVADIALDHANRPAAHRPLEIFRPSPDHVVERDDLGAALVAQQIDDMRADKSGPASDQNSFSLQISQDTLLFSLLSRPKTPLDASRSLRRAYAASTNSDLFQLARPLRSTCSGRSSGIDRKRKELIGQRFGDRQIPGAISETGISLLKMDWHGIMNADADAGCLRLSAPHRAAQAVRHRRDRRAGCARAALAACIGCFASRRSYCDGHRPARFGPGFDVVHLHVQHRALDSVHAIVVTGTT